MLTCQSLSMPLAGAFYGTAAVENLQKAMVALAQAAPWPAANPGPVTGVVDNVMIMAIAGTINAVPGLPGEIKFAITAAAAGAITNANMKAEAVKAIEQYAAELTTAYVALLAKYAGSGGAPPVSTGATGPGGPLTSKMAIGMRPDILSRYLATTGQSTAGGGAAASGGGFMTKAGSFLPVVPPGTPWYKNYKVWAGVGGVAVVGVVAYKVLAR